MLEFVEGDVRFKVESGPSDVRGERWKATAKAVHVADGRVIAEVTTQALHGTAEDAAHRALVMLRDRVFDTESE